MSDPKKLQLPHREKVRQMQVAGYQELEQQQEQAGPRGTDPEGQARAMRRTRRDKLPSRKEQS